MQNCKTIKINALGLQWKSCSFYMTSQSFKKHSERLCVTTSWGQIQPSNVPAFTPVQKRSSTFSLAMGPSMRDHFPTMVSSFWLLAFNRGKSKNITFKVQMSEKKILYIYIYNPNDPMFWLEKALFLQDSTPQNRGQAGFICIYIVIIYLYLHSPSRTFQHGTILFFHGTSPCLWTFTVFIQGSSNHQTTYLGGIKQAANVWCCLRDFPEKNSASFGLVI